jgi:hypothetical protein
MVDGGWGKLMLRKSSHCGLCIWRLLVAPDGRYEKVCRCRLRFACCSTGT